MEKEVIMKDFYAELVEYTGRPYELVQRRCETALIELAWKFVEDYEDDPIASYRDNDLYVFDLSHYQTLLQQGGFPGWLIDKLNKYKCKKVLDFGGGIGEYTILAWQNGIKADYLEVDGSKTMEYAKWRFAKYGFNPEILDITTELKGRKYDCVVAMDVFEHIEDPGPIIKKVSTITKYLIVNPEELPYNFLYPQHISRFDDDLAKYFVKVDGHLWKVIE